jgi:uncharacterized protein
MKIILIHGKDTDPSQKWYPWLGEELKKRGHTFIAPALPNSSEPLMSEWLLEIDKTNPDESTVLIGHSRGGVAIMRWLERQAPERKIAKLILVATNSGKWEDKAIPNESNYGFYTKTGYDFDKIKSHCHNFVVFHSRDDQWVPFAHGEANAKGLSAKFLRFDHYGHFGKMAASIPELLEEVLRT